MYRVHLSQEQSRELQRRARDKNTKPRTRDRLEMVRLSNAGWSIPKIAQHLGIHEQRVRHWIKTYLADGFDALPDKEHPGRTSALTPQVLEALRAEFGSSQRTWTAGQISQWVAAEHGLHLSPQHLSSMLRRARLSYKRTTRSLQHKQKPEEVERKGADLETLKRGHTPV